MSPGRSPPAWEPRGPKSSRWVSTSVSAVTTASGSTRSGRWTTTTRRRSAITCRSQPTRTCGMGRTRVETTSPGPPTDGTVETWSVPRSHPFFGDQFTTYVQSGPTEGNDHYHGYEFTLNKQFSDGWSFMVSLGTNLRKIRANDPTTPNALVYSYANQLNEWNKSVKINASLRAAVRLPVLHVDSGTERELGSGGRFVSATRCGAPRPSSRRRRSPGCRS